MRSPPRPDDENDWFQTSSAQSASAVLGGAPLHAASEIEKPAPTIATIFCDGSCVGNPGPGGWAALIRIQGQPERLISGHEPDTTNNRMELRAAIEGLKNLPKNTQIEVFTDSEYLIKGMTQWRAGWEKRGWRTAADKPVANQDLWKILSSTVVGLDVDWSWVKGHSGHPENERVDKAAQKAAKSLGAKSSVSANSTVKKQRKRRGGKKSKRGRPTPPWLAQKREKARQILQKIDARKPKPLSAIKAPDPQELQRLKDLDSYEGA